MTDFWQTVIGILGSVGVGGMIVAALSSWLGKVWAERLMAKESAKYQKDLERLIKQLEHKNYVSKVRFDAEFAIYRNLSASMVDAIEKVGILFPAGKDFHFSGDEAQWQEHYESIFLEAKNALLIFNHCLDQNMAFINEDLYSLLHAISDACNRQIVFFAYTFLKEHKRNIPASEEQKCWETTAILFDKQREVQEKLHEIIKNLDVAD